MIIERNMVIKEILNCIDNNYLRYYRNEQKDVKDKGILGNWSLKDNNTVRD
jgi:hypothetical protein